MTDAQPDDRRPTARSCCTANNQLQYVTLALGSALALFLYPHSLTGVLASRGRNVLKRNMVALPAYSLLLGLLALLGYVAIAAGDQADHEQRHRPARTPTRSSRCCSTASSRRGSPASRSRPSASARWCRRRSCRSPRRTCGPATSTRSTSSRDATPAQEAKQAKLASLVVKFGAVLFIVVIDPQFSIDLQLIGGVIILQTLPAVAIALYTRWLHRWALVAGWAVGMGWGMYLLYLIPNPATRPRALRRLGARAGQADHARLAPVRGLAGADLRRASWRWRVNLLVAVVVTLVIRRLNVSNGVDETTGEDYHVDEHDENLREIGGPEPTRPASATST